MYMYVVCIHVFVLHAVPVSDRIVEELHCTYMVTLLYDFDVCYVHVQCTYSATHFTLHVHVHVFLFMCIYICSCTCICTYVFMYNVCIVCVSPSQMVWEQSCELVIMLTEVVESGKVRFSTI